MDKNILMLVAPTNFRDEEYFISREIFEKNGFKVEVLSMDPEPTSKLGKIIKTDKYIQDLENWDNYDALVLVGGSGGEIYFENVRLRDLLKKFPLEQKILGAICMAPAILARTGILKGKKATVYPSYEVDLKDNEVIYEKIDVLQDGNLITASGVESTEKFAQLISENLKK